MRETLNASGKRNRRLESTYCPDLVEMFFYLEMMEVSSSRKNITNKQNRKEKLQPMASNPIKRVTFAEQISGAVEEPNPAASVDPSNPYRAYRNTTPLNHRCPCSSPSAFSPPPAAPAVAADHLLLSGDLPRRSSNPSPATGSCSAARQSGPVPLSPSNAFLWTNSGPGSGSFGMSQETPSSKRKRISSLIKDWCEEILGKDDKFTPTDKGFAKKQQTKRMVSHIQQIGEWCREIVAEEDGFTYSTEVEDGGEAEEVIVDKDGDKTLIKIKCKCGSCIDIVLVGDFCFYKLI